MTKFLNTPQAGVIVKLSGEIHSYRCTRSSASFIYSQNDKNKLGVIAAASVIAGMGGQAASVASHASDMEEPAEYLDFLLNGYSLKGWVWRSPFKEGDIVNVAAEWRGDHYEIYGIARPSDKMIALYPHCSRSTRTHINNAAKWCILCNTGFFGFMAAWFVYMGGPGLLTEPEVLWPCFGVLLFLILMFFKLSQQYMPFVRLAEKIFHVLELPDVKNIDLVKSSKQQRTTEDAPEFGAFYYKY